jgi:TATA-binding protein-associated factor
MTTRLDRLFVLLDQGSSQVTRKAAAAELGEVQRLHPHELNNLLAKVRHYLHSSNWDTRLAAGQAVEAIVKNVSDWFPAGAAGGTDPTDAGDTGRMTFALFNINSIIDCGKDLLASDGCEFDDRSSNCDGDSGRERVMEQRRLLNNRLGLGSASTGGICGDLSEELISNEDLMRQPQLRDNSKGKRQICELTRPISKKVKKEDSSNCDTSDKIIDFNSLEDWPLEWFADELMTDLFSPCWETRHGAATGLREIVKLQGRCAGRVATADPKHMDNLNQGKCVRLL